MTMSPKIDVCYKIMLLGDSGVGKTALLERATLQMYQEKCRPTIGIDYRTKLFSIDGANVKLQIWDTTGQERFQTVTRCFYRGTKGVILVYDITDKQSFETLSYWLDCIKKDMDNHCIEPVPIILIGNKLDMEGQREVSYKEGKKLATSRYMYGFMEASAKDGYNVFNAFACVAQAAIEVNNPKLMHAYLTREELEEKMNEQNKHKTLSVTDLRKITSNRRQKSKKILVNKMMGCFSCTRVKAEDHFKT